MRNGIVGILALLVLSFSQWLPATQPPEEVKISNPEEYEASYAFGASFASDGPVLLVGMPSHQFFTGGPVFPGRFRSYRDDGFGNWMFEREYRSPYNSDDGFGGSVALSGDTAVFGVPKDSGKAHVYVRTDGIWRLQATLRASDPGEGDEFGWAVSISGDTIVIGSHQDDSPLDSAGSLYVFVRSGASWIQQAKITAPDAAAGDKFGDAVSIFGDTIIAGAPYDDDGATNSGSVYVFTRTSGVWTQQAKLSAPNPIPGRLIGSAVSLSGDIAAVGAPYDEQRLGSVFIFERTGTSWGVPAKFSPPPQWGNTTYFGNSVSTDGDTVVVGATWVGPTGTVFLYRRSEGAWGENATIESPMPRDVLSPFVSRYFGFKVAVVAGRLFVSDPYDYEAGAFCGATYVFEETGGVWTQQSKIFPASVAGGDSFGSAVSVSGTTMAIGVESDQTTGEDSGAAYIYTAVDGEWEQQSRLFPSEPHRKRSFGSSISINEDTCIVGAPGADGMGMAYQKGGSAHVFKRVGSGWEQEATLVPQDVDASFQFGRAVSISGDSVIVGAPNWVSDNTAVYGSAHIYTRGSGLWSQEAQLLPPDPLSFSSFGASVSIDGDIAIVGTYPRAGSTPVPVPLAYVYARSRSTWHLAYTVRSDLNGFGNTPFYNSVGVSGDTVVIGCPWDSDVGSQTGAVYVYARSGESWVEQAKILSPENLSYNKFGSQVSIRGDVLVASGKSNSTPEPYSGSIYVFTRAEGVWTFRFKLNAADTVYGENFGSSLAVGGRTVVAGAPQNSDPEFVSGSVHAYEIFHILKFRTDGTRLASLLGTTHQVIFHGDDATSVLAVSPEGFAFDHWELGGVPVSSDNPLTVESVTEDTTYTAVFHSTAASTGWHFYE